MFELFSKTTGMGKMKRKLVLGAKNKRFYYVHVGMKYFGYRHFFAMVDNLLVDVDGKITNPWGHANIGNRGVYRITPYPYLPLPREY